VVVPEPLEKLILGALAKEPAKRPKDAFTFAAQLRNLKRTLQVDRRSDSETSRPTEVPVAGLVTGPSGSVNDLQPGLASGELLSTSGIPSQAFATTERENARAANAGGITAAPTVFPNTMVGMTAPSTTGATLLNPSVSERAVMAGETASAHTSAAVAEGGTTRPLIGGLLDRNASTHSMALEHPRPRSTEGTPPMAFMPTDTTRTEPWQPQHTLRMDPQAQAQAAGRVDRASDLLALLPANEPILARSDGGASKTLAPGRSRPSRPFIAIALGLAATLTLIVTVTLGVFGARHASAPEGEATGADGTVATPATAPFAAPILAPPLDTDPSRNPTPPPSPSPDLPHAEAPRVEPNETTANPATTAEPPQPLRVHADPMAASSPVQERPSDLSRPSPPPVPRPSASARPPKRKLPGSGL
jgi:hypothetical protein